MKKNKLSYLLLHIIFPERCRFCGKVIRLNTEYCEECRDTVHVIGSPVCNFCGSEKKLCTCKKAKRFYDGVTAPYYYEGPAAKCIKRLKFNEKLKNADFLADKMYSALKNNCEAAKFDLLCCVPMSAHERKSRGYNQSELIAKALSKRMGIPFEKEMLKKIYDTKSQRTLSSHERSGNLIGVFESEDATGKTVLLCDDVKTTGASLNECAKMLKLAGADRVWCVVAACSQTKEK